MNIGFLGEFGLVTIVVISWLSLYFIIVVWIFLYRYIALCASISREKDYLETFLLGKLTIPKNSLLGTNLRKLTRLNINKEAFEYCLVNSIKSASVGLTILAIVASTAPFIGLFGTVVEILEAFSKLGGGTRASLDVIAPTISKALVATACGILTAIPAYSFHLLLKRKVYELTTILRLQISILSQDKE